LLDVVWAVFASGHGAPPDCLRPGTESPAALLMANVNIMLAQRAIIRVDTRQTHAGR
jgi:hypothetical protein